MKFRKFIGGCALAGKQVVAYDSECKGQSIVIIAAETVGGNPVRYQTENGLGKKEWRTVSEKRLTLDEYDDFIDTVSENASSSQDAGTVVRALVELGYPSELFHN